MLLKKYRYALHSLALAWLFAVLSCIEDKKTVKKQEVAFTKEGELAFIRKSDKTPIVLDIEIADNEYETQTGLMYRQTMDDRQAMLFTFPDERPRYFYMKNTKIPLDIIYLNADSTIVSISKNAKPMDRTTLPSGAPAQFVVEVNAGLSDRWGLQEGDRMQVKKTLSQQP